MYASHSHRRRRERGVHAHATVARNRASLSPRWVLLCFIGAFVLLANARHTLFPKESFLGSLWSTPISRSQGVEYELHTLPVDEKAVADGDTITIYIDTPYPRESSNVPREVQEAAAKRTKARESKNYQKSDALQKIIVDAGYRKVLNLRGVHVLAKKYQIRLRGIDAPENSMPYGKEAKEELVKLVQGRPLKFPYMILTGTVDWLEMFTAMGSLCRNKSVFITLMNREHMFKKGLTWHYSAYDRRPDLAKTEIVSMGEPAQARRLGLWALPNPEKPWEWRKEKRVRKWWVSQPSPVTKKT